MLTRSFSLRAPLHMKRQITHFVKTDNTARTATDTTAAENTNYTIAWSDLTAAGFVNGDDVLILVAVKHYGSDANANNLFSVGFGTTFAGRTEDTTGNQRAEPVGTNGGDQYLWIDRKTLTANDNIYFKQQCTSGTATYNEFNCLILKLGDLTSNDFIYDEVTTSGDAATTYETDGATVTVPLTGNWLFIACARYLVDAIDDDYMFLAIHNGTTTIAEAKTDGEDTGDERVFGTMAYIAGATATTAIQAQYKVSNTTTHDLITTKIFGLRLGAFVSAAGSRNTTTLTHNVLDTYQEFEGFGTYNHPLTGPLLVLGWPMHTLTAANQGPYGRIQIDGSDWPVANANRLNARDNGTVAQIAPLLFGYKATEAAGAKDIDLDTAEDQSVAASHTSVDHTAVAISLFLA